MPNVIDHFMWGYQQHFRVWLSTMAKRVFELLDERFCPEIFIVGVLIDDIEERHPACVEPENDFWIHSEAFASTLQIAREIYGAYPENNLFHSHPIAQENHESSLFRRSICDAIKKIVEENSEIPDYFYVSLPTKVNGYLVCVVLRLQKIIVDLYPSLSTSRVEIHEYRTAKVATSLIDATADSFLEKASNELRFPDSGVGSGSLSAEEIVRKAGYDFVMGMAYRASNTTIGGWHGLYEACNRIASAFYEKSVGTGSFVLADRTNQVIQTKIEFTQPSELGNTRGARKLLELASQGLAIHTDSEKIYGLVKYNSNSTIEENIFLINFFEHHHWEILHSNKIMMRAKYGHPYLPKPSFKDEKLRTDLPRIFNKITSKQIDRIVDLVYEAEQESHGTMLVISRRAKEEAKRLGKQATLIKPKILSSKILRSLTSIDGAVLMNPKGTCYAIGVILDGMATEDGDSTRGARYNSALRYVKTSKVPCLAIVISEDGGIDFIPDLKPMINISEIDEKIATLNLILKSDLAYHNFQRQYHDTMQWLSSHRFYLSDENCHLINRMMDMIASRAMCDDAERRRLLYGKFTQDSKFDSQKYLIDQ